MQRSSINYKTNYIRFRILTIIHQQEEKGKEYTITAFSQYFSDKDILLYAPKTIAKHLKAMVKEGILLLEDKSYSDRPRMRINYYQFPTNMQKDSGGGE